MFRLCITFCFFFLINNAWHVAGREMWAIHWNGYHSHDEWAVTSNCSTVLLSATFFTASYHQIARSHWVRSEVNSRGGTKPQLIQKCPCSFYDSSHFHSTMQYIYLWHFCVIKNNSTPSRPTSIPYHFIFYCNLCTTMWKKPHSLSINIWLIIYLAYKQKNKCILPKHNRLIKNMGF